MAPARTSLRTVLKRVALVGWISGGGAVSLGIGGAGTVGGSGIWTYGGGLVDVEAPDVCTAVTVCLSLTLLAFPARTDRAGSAPPKVCCSGKLSTGVSKLFSPLSCLSMYFCFRSKKSSRSNCPEIALSHSSLNRSTSCVNAC